MTLTQSSGGVRQRGGSWSARVSDVLLSDRDIRAALGSGDLALDPFDPTLIQPSSIDVRLDRYFRVFNNSRYTHIDPRLPQEDLTTLVEVGDGTGEDGTAVSDGGVAAEAFILHPGEFVLGSTLELVTVPDNLAARLEGKSSLGRLGLLTHSTAGFVDPGFTGHITLELSNTANLPIALYPGMKIGQLALFNLSSPAEAPYGSGPLGSKYQGQRGPTPSKAYLNFRK
jgi:dCTP deaminase